MSAQNSAGIQTLLDAEREAQKIVQKAREYRTKRIRDAKTEAQKEIDEYKQSKEEEFKKYESEQSSGNATAESEAQTETDETISGIKSLGSQKGDDVVGELLKAVTDVRPVVPDRS